MTGWNFDGLNRMGKGKTKGPEPVPKKKTNIRKNSTLGSGSKPLPDFTNNIWNQSLSECGNVRFQEQNQTKQQK